MGIVKEDNFAATGTFSTSPNLGKHGWFCELAETGWSRWMIGYTLYIFGVVSEASWFGRQ